MKIAISAQGSQLEDLVDPRFGRARWFIIAAQETGDWTAPDNSTNVEARGGAGVQAGTPVASHGVSAVITGNVGPNAHKVLAAAGITIHLVGNGVKVSEAIEAFKRGELPAVDAPTVSGHWS
jgi:predicted Fe-Mo cluster-binding NifX family protein